MNQIKEKWARLSLVPVSMMVAASAHAGPIDTLLDAIDISGVSAKVTAVATVIVGIALVMKGPVIAKRLISRI